MFDFGIRHVSICTPVGRQGRPFFRVVFANGHILLRAIRNALATVD